MRYLVCQEWSNTSGNHAGMLHMCNLLAASYPDEYEVIVFPDLYRHVFGRGFVKKLMSMIVRKIWTPYLYRKIGAQLNKKLANSDSVFLLEYCEKLFPQIALAETLKRNRKDVRVYGMVHLVPEKIIASFPVPELNVWLSYLDAVVTLGHSLSAFFVSHIGFPEERVKTLFHYVDLEYYFPLNDCDLSVDAHSQPLEVVVMGNQKRNLSVLQEVVRGNQDIHFTVCQGVNDMSGLFSCCENVRLVGFVSESELLSIMRNADISLNIMEDTIGSNVIMTSMAVGLPVVVSDVGSIRDYCDESNAYFCSNSDVASFSFALNALEKNREKLRLMKVRSIEKSRNFSIDRFHVALSHMVSDAD